jgi:hypothetical protein
MNIIAIKIATTNIATKAMLICSSDSVLAFAILFETKMMFILPLIITGK